MDNNLSELSETDLDLRAARTLGLTVVEKDGMFFLKSKKKRNETDTRFVPHYCADISAALDLISHVVATTHNASAPFRMEIVVHEGAASARVISDKHGVLQSVTVDGDLRKSIPRAVTQAALQWAESLGEPIDK